MIKQILHIEGLTVLLLSVCIYAYFDFSWIAFLLLLLVPDISMFGYLINHKVGAGIYNLFHTYSLPLVVILLSIALSNATALQIGIIWTSHIGMDRMFGFGLKYQNDFKDTHLNRI